MFIHLFDQCMACIIMLPKVHFNFWNLWQKKRKYIKPQLLLLTSEERAGRTFSKHKQKTAAVWQSQHRQWKWKSVSTVDRMEASSWQPSAEKQRHQEEGPHGRPCRHACQQSEGNGLHQTVKRVPLNNYLVGTLETDKDRKSLNVIFITFFY